MKGINDCSWDEFNYALRVGVTAPFYLTKLFLPYFAPGAAIVNISSSRDRLSQPQTESYTAPVRAHRRGLPGHPQGRHHGAYPRTCREPCRQGACQFHFARLADTDFRVYSGPDAAQHPAGRGGRLSISPVWCSISALRRLVSSLEKTSVSTGE